MQQRAPPLFHSLDFVRLSLLRVRLVYVAADEDSTDLPEIEDNERDFDWQWAALQRVSRLCAIPFPTWNSIFKDVFPFPNSKLFVQCADPSFGMIHIFEIVDHMKGMFEMQRAQGSTPVQRCIC
jgi:hypothetical protein